MFPFLLIQTRTVYVSGREPTDPVLPAREKKHFPLFLALPDLRDLFQDNRKKSGTTDVRGC